MRHRKNTNRLGRTKSHRYATLKNLARAVFINQSIKTTKVKAKEAKAFIDKLISIAKDNTQHHQRLAFSILPDKEVIKELFKEIAPRFKDRHGGYTRLIPLNFRQGDGADMVILELTEKKIVEKAKEKPKKPTAKEKAPALKKEEKGAEHKVVPEHKAALKPKVAVAEEIAKEKARTEEKKQKGFLKGIRQIFRRKSF